MNEGQSSGLQVLEVAFSTRKKEARGLWKQYRNSYGDVIMKHFEEPEYAYDYYEFGEYAEFTIEEGGRIVHQTYVWLESVVD